MIRRLPRPASRPEPSRPRAPSPAPRTEISLCYIVFIALEPISIPNSPPCDPAPRSPTGAHTKPVGFMGGQPQKAPIRHSTRLRAASRRTETYQKPELSIGATRPSRRNFNREMPALASHLAGAGAARTFVGRSAPTRRPRRRVENSRRGRRRRMAIATRVGRDLEDRVMS